MIACWFHSREEREERVRGEKEQHYAMLPLPLPKHEIIVISYHHHGEFFKKKKKKKIIIQDQNLSTYHEPSASCSLLEVR
jgi:hypothetical protein